MILKDAFFASELELYFTFLSTHNILGGRGRDKHILNDITTQARSSGPPVPQLAEHGPDSWGSLWGLVL